MDERKPQPEENPPFPIPTYRFDQKNEMFKRPFWDPKMKPYGKRFYKESKYSENIGFRKMDYAFRYGAWSVELSAAFGVSRSNSGLYSWDGVPERIKHWVETGGPVRMSPKEMTRIVKKVAHFYGADLVGICKLHPNWVYSNEYNASTGEHYPIEIPDKCHNAVVMALEMDYDAIRTSPSGVEAAAVGLGYSKMAFVANLVAMFIRILGYRAIPSGNDTALSIPLAMAAGLGEPGRLGLLITKKFGPRVRLCKVFTDLPLHYDSYNPFGVREFCKVCKKCATNCPSQAIPYGDMATQGHNISNQSGLLKWYVDCEKCFKWWAKIRMDCGNCIQTCPFNKGVGMIHDISRSLIQRRLTMIDRVLVWMDTLMGYDKRVPPENFWGND